LAVCASNTAAVVAAADLVVQSSARRACTDRDNADVFVAPLIVLQSPAADAASATADGIAAAAAAAASTVLLKLDALHGVGDVVIERARALGAGVDEVHVPPETTGVLIPTGLQQRKE
jgi:hypothetical protein